MNQTIVSVDWLVENLEREDLIILDASPASNVSGKESAFEKSAIPHSRCFKIKENFTDKSAAFPNTVPSSDQFQLECRKLGINKNSQIIIYDNLGVYTSPRAWWLFKTMGHETVAVLDGGLPAWIAAGHPVVDKEKILEENVLGDFEAVFHKDNAKQYVDLVQNCSLENFLVVDARSAGRFAGTAPEPRQHLKSGSIPNSINLPYQEVLENGKFKSVESLKEIFSFKVGEPRALVFSCGSGLTACIIMLAGEISIQGGRQIYDGSWTEWAELQGLVIEAG